MEAHSAQPHHALTQAPRQSSVPLKPRLHSGLSRGFSSALSCQRSSSLEAPECLQKQKPGSSFPRVRGPFMPFWGRHKLLSTLGHRLGLFLMCRVCKIRWEGNFLCEANSFFLSSCASGPGGAIWSVRLDSHVSDAAGVWRPLPN